MGIHDGTSQNKRKQFLSDEEFVNIDELSFQDLLCFTVDLAKKIKYFNLNNKQDGYWDELFKYDEIFIIAEIIDVDIKGVEYEFVNLLELDAETKGEYWEKQLDLIFKLADYVISWYSRLSYVNAYHFEGFVKVFDELIRKKLSENISICKAIILREKIFKIDSEAIQKFQEFKNSKQGKILLKNDVELKDNIDISSQFERTFYAFYNAINYLKQISTKYQEKSLQNKSHSPYVALFITFVKLYSNIRNRMNPFSNKYFQFYYNNILKIKPREYSPDSTYMVFSLKDEFDHFLIPKGTKFLAGKDENKKSIYYKSETDLAINKAKVSKIHTLYLEKDELIWPLSNCTNLFVNEIPCPSVEELKATEKEIWPLFGDNIGDSAYKADIGFAISDYNFLLNEGYREIKITICFTPESFELFTQKLNESKGEYSQKEVLIKLFSNIFSISISTLEGWFDIQNYIFDCSLINNKLEPNVVSILFSLSVDDPPFTNYASKNHGYTFEEGLPVVKFLINNASYLFPYSLVKNLEIERIKTDVEVEGVKNVLVYNELGKIDTSKPFYPFGVIPQINSSFIIGNYEMSRKKITDMEMQIDWSNLPDMGKGFNDYFSEYDEEIKESDYTCNFTFLNKGCWQPEDKQLQEKVDLFTPLKNGSVNTSVFKNINTLYFHASERKRTEKEFVFNKNSLNGFIKITLTNPPFAFGHNKYQVSLTKVTMENAKNKKQKPLPNPPASPMIDNLSINYSSKSVIEFTSKQSSQVKDVKCFYHIHPWGYEEILQKNHCKSNRLLPNYKYRGSVYLGLENAKPNMTISIFFNLLDDAILTEESDPPEIFWEYLSSNQWKILPDSNIVSDSTDSFLESGIVMVRLPEDINLGNTILSNQYHWLKVSVKESAESVCSLVNISTQAIKVTWENEGNTLTHLKSPLPAFTINKSEKLLPGIKTMAQVVPSFNGKPTEDISQTKIRVGERLKHKNRAVTPWDYERLVLENFPSIYKVKCLPHQSSKKRIHPGNTLLVVIGNTDRNTLRVDYEPMVNNSTLHKIKVFLSNIASNFLNIEVRNPVYERVQVRCSVKFSDGLDAGFFIGKLNFEITNYLTPWYTSEENEPGFGKVIKCSDVLAFIQGLDFVDFITNFSVLKISRDTNKKYYLYDTAKKWYSSYSITTDNDDEVLSQLTILKPADPWGILISAEKHAIEIINTKKEIEALKTGIDELEVGDTFIIE